MLSAPPATIRSASPTLDLARRDGDCVHPAAAQPVHRRAWHGLGKASQEQRHADDVAIVLTRLIGAAEDHLIDDRAGRSTAGEPGASG